MNCVCSDPLCACSIIFSCYVQCHVMTASRTYLSWYRTIFRMHHNTGTSSLLRGKQGHDADKWLSIESFYTGIQLIYINTLYSLAAMLYWLFWRCKDNAVVTWWLVTMAAQQHWRKWCTWHIHIFVSYVHLPHTCRVSYDYHRWSCCTKAFVTASNLSQPAIRPINWKIWDFVTALPLHLYQLTRRG